MKLTCFILLLPLVSTISMFFLIVWPLYLLLGVNLPRKERRLILILFASTIFMAPFVGVHAAYSYGLSGTVEGTMLGMMAHIEVSFFVCDFVIRMALIHYLGSSFGHNV
jgi:hypothetical protein